MYSPFTKLIMPLMAEENATEIKPKATQAKTSPKPKKSDDGAPNQTEILP